MVNGGTASPIRLANHGADMRCQAPGYAQVDLSLSKKFRVTERFTIQFRADAFNAFNRVNLNNPVTDLVNNNFGRSVGTQTPKSYQLGLRAMF